MRTIDEHYEVHEKYNKARKFTGMTGSYSYGLADSEFSINVQGDKTEYDYRGRLSLRSKRNGKVLKKKDGTALAKDIRIKAENIAELEKVLKEKIIESFHALYGDNCSIIYADAQMMRTDDLTLPSAIDLYGVEYLLSDRKVRENRVQKRINDMKKVAICLEGYRLDTIPQSALIRAREGHGSSLDTAYNDLLLFYVFLQRRHLYFGQNPFENYFSKYPKRLKRDAEKEIAAANREKSLEDGVFRQLNRLISEAKPDDPLVTGLLLIRDTGIDAETACSLKWGDLIFDGLPPLENTCQVRVWVEKTVSSTHDYTRPIFRFAAAELRRRHDALLVADPDLDRKLLLGGLGRDKLVAYCRTALLSCHANYGEIKDARTPSTGGGVALLHSDFCYRLRYYCGMTNEGELSYMRVKALNNSVTTDNYRSLSSPSGQMRLLLMLDRDTRFDPMPASIKIVAGKVKNADGIQFKALIPPDDPKRTTRATVTLKLKKGQTFQAFAPGGLNIRITTNLLDAPNTDTKDQPLLESTLNIEKGNQEQLCLFDL